MPMVTYQAFVSLVYDETPDGAIASASENSEFLADIGRFWSENRDELKPMTRSQARDVVQESLEL